ncbi:MAG: UDP-3-O-[3-hydroxymyristoyl] N-acetylglucosamine deacetylase [Candidatus Eremiobacteraeota bacterium]|nr:UDP-3-O-[3-hydroxymyristoyl] N-acetylglucosamine deacetylase [Candidatus Eremiobacteraeota bacterium]
MTVQYQHTLRGPFEIEGVGIHTGAAARVRVEPAGTGEGVTFVLPGGERISALAENVTETARATVLGTGNASVSTVEHLLAALFGMGIDNASIAISGPEVPVADGSSAVFAEHIVRVGSVAQNELRRTFVPSHAQFFRDGDRALILLPAARFRVRYVADYAAPIGSQYFDAEIDPEVFRDTIAGARTFGYLHEVENLRKRGLAQGGSLDNAVVFGPDGPMQPLRWPDEPVRHKVLDLLGDLSLLGVRPQCEVIAIKSGHKLHCTATKELRRQIVRAVPSANVR